jgi:D-arabinose 1-dehydrogenase-like Zn-dependent alcohol dehydrogenase
MPATLWSGSWKRGAKLRFAQCSTPTTSARSGVPKARINTVVDFQATRAHGVTTLGTREAGGLPAPSELAVLAATGALEIPIAATYPMERIQDAYRQLSVWETRGRIVLRPQG